MDGDARDGFRDELVRLLPRLRRFAHALAGSAADGDDLVQAACVRAIVHQDSWQRGTRLDSWMFRIIQNLHTDAIRAGRVRGAGFETVDPDTIWGGDAAEDTESHLMLDAVRRIVHRLPEEQRAVLTLVCVEGFTYKETAESLGVPIGTVMSRLSRARAAVVNTLARAEQPALIGGAPRLTSEGSS